MCVKRAFFMKLFLVLCVQSVYDVDVPIIQNKKRRNMNSMKNFTRILLVVLSLMMALSAVGCSANKAPAAAPEVNVPVEDIANELMAMPETFPMLGFMGEEILTDMFGIDFSLLEEYSLNDPMMNVHAHILYIAKVKDAADVETVKASFQTRLEAMQSSFEMYLPDQYDLAMEGKIVDNGRYVMLVIAPDTDAVIEKFNAALTAK